MALLALSGVFAGCASTAPAARSGGACAMPQRVSATGFSHGGNADAVAARSAGGDRLTGVAADLEHEHAGIPTPEPARPTREVQFAGPTPQVPIPVSGGVMALPASPAY
ncbi:MAG: hypothetical protein JNK72_25285 [Myxococcales bacterium]|nr:hypothetical protein [Myxococcales bacterium]